MAGVKVKTKETLQALIYETEYSFESASDFFAWEDYKRESATEFAQMFTGDGDFQSSTEDLEGDEEGSPIVNTRVKKKETMH
jgi:hypothetical protein